MAEAGQDLHAQFPGEGIILHALSLEDRDFRAIADRHHMVAAELERIGKGPAPKDDDRIEALKKECRELLDEVAVMIASRKAE